MVRWLCNLLSNKLIDLKIKREFEHFMDSSLSDVQSIKVKVDRLISQYNSHYYSNVYLFVDDKTHKKGESSFAYPLFVIKKYYIYFWESESWTRAIMLRILHFLFYSIKYIDCTWEKKVKHRTYRELGSELDQLVLEKKTYDITFERTHVYSKEDEADYLYELDN